MSITVTRHGPDEARELTSVVRDVWAEVYGEPPFEKGPEQVQGFLDGWPRRLAAPGFRLVVARDGAEPAGIVYGHQLTPDTLWWSDAVGPLDVDTEERPGRTLAIIDMLTRSGWRRRGVARAMHDALVGGNEDRVTLLVRPDNGPARKAYEAWGYRKVGRLQPFPPDGPVFDSMLRP